MIDINFDKDHLWHPYTSMKNPLAVYPVKSAKGVYLTLEDGTKLIDGMSSWWAVIHGYNHPILNDALSAQIKKMSHVMFGGITHKPAVDLAKLLIDITPETLNKVFLCDSGSISVEVAIKMAIQYWFSRDMPKKHKLLTIKGGYHGDTFAAMSVCDPVTGMHDIFKDILPVHFFANTPQCKYNESCTKEDIKDIEKIICINHSKIAAVILEPIVQGAGGMRFYSPDYLKKVKILCDKFDVLLIFDEIATGFGRTGSLFACEQADVVPDIMCLGKALTGGYMTLAATLTTKKVSDGISSGKFGTLMHGPTFMGNPLACSVALASIKLLLSYDWKSKIKNIENQLNEELKQCETLSSVKDVRVLGAIGVVEMKKNVDVGKIQRKFVEKGIWIRPFGKLIYIMPPYIICEHELSMLTSAIYEIANEL